MRERLNSANWWGEGVRAYEEGSRQARGLRGRPPRRTESHCGYSPRSQERRARELAIPDSHASAVGLEHIMCLVRC